MAPEKDNARAQLAMSAISQAMARSGQRAIARFVPRAKGAVQMGLLSPCLRPEESFSQPDCMWMNILPFAEDVRTATFMSFEDQPKRMPTTEQVDAMRQVVESMALTAGEALLPYQSGFQQSAVDQPFAVAVSDVAFCCQFITPKLAGIHAAGTPRMF